MWGGGTSTERRRPRRAICRSCAKTHVLLAEDTLVRRRHKVEVIGAAFVAKMNGSGRHAIAAAVGVTEWMVASWMRRFALKAEGIRRHFTAWLGVLDPGHGRLAPCVSVFADALEVIGVVGMVAVRRFGPKDVWLLASALTEGGLLATPDHQYRRPV